MKILCGTARTCAGMQLRHRLLVALCDSTFRSHLDVSPSTGCMPPNGGHVRAATTWTKLFPSLLLSRTTRPWTAGITRTMSALQWLLRLPNINSGKARRNSTAGITNCPCSCRPVGCKHLSGCHAHDRLPLPLSPPTAHHAHNRCKHGGHALHADGSPPQRDTTRGTGAFK
jgi:hypothetical protein